MLSRLELDILERRLAGVFPVDRHRGARGHRFQEQADPCALKREDQRLDGGACDELESILERKKAFFFDAHIMRAKRHRRQLYGRNPQELPIEKDVGLDRIRLDHDAFRQGVWREESKKPDESRQGQPRRLQR